MLYVNNTNFGVKSTGLTHPLHKKIRGRSPHTGPMAYGN